jgi:hypothetical protein
MHLFIDINIGKPSYLLCLLVMTESLTPASYSDGPVFDPQLEG